MSSTTLLGICGSLRAASFNRMLLNDAVRHFAPDSYADANLRLPLYDGDLEAAEGIPEGVVTLAAQIAAADAIVITGPEYNKAMSGVLKNALDWISRVEGNPWRDKPVAILSAAAGRAGGERTQMTLRHAMGAFRAHVLPGPEVLVGAAHNAFDDDGHLKDAQSEKLLRALMDELRASLPD